MVNDNGDGVIRWSVQSRKDFLDAEWNVIPPETIMSAIRKARNERGGL